LGEPSIAFYLSGANQSSEFGKSKTSGAKLDIG